MKEELRKPVDVKGPEGLWGFYNTLFNNMTASKDGYLLTIAQDEAVSRLDHFTPEQERAFWDFTFSKAAEGINNPAARGLKDNLDDTTTNTVMVALNDGRVAWQGVGTTHGHIIWNNKDKDFGNIRERLIVDRTKFAGSAEPYLPLGHVIIDLSKPDYADNIRAARQNLKAQFGKVGMAEEDIGFSLYTENTYSEDPRKSGRMVVEIWTKEHHSVASFSQWFRYWNGLWDNPVLNKEPTGLQYKYFRPEIGSPG